MFKHYDVDNTKNIPTLNKLSLMLFMTYEFLKFKTIEKIISGRAVIFSNTFVFF